VPPPKAASVPPKSSPLPQSDAVKLDASVRRVAELEGTSLEIAFEHVRAVLSTLREAAGEREFLDVTAQLPDEYEVALRGT